MTETLAEPWGMLGKRSWSNFFHFLVFLSKNLVKQVCISVGCVPPASVVATRCQYWRSLSRGISVWAFSVWAVSVQRGLYPVGTVWGLSVHGGLCQREASVQRETPSPCEQNDSHTLLKTLPCPNLHLRVVLIGFRPKLRGWRPTSSPRLGNFPSATVKYRI